MIFSRSKVSQAHTTHTTRGPHRHSLSMIAEPHGGSLVNTMLTDAAAKAAEIQSCDFEVELDERQLCDVELLMQVSEFQFKRARSEEFQRVLALTRIE